MKIYKVITQRDEWFKSKFNPELLQACINEHASRGWRVVSVTATDVGSFFGSFWQKGGGATRQELVVLLEKDVDSHEAHAAEERAWVEAERARALAAEAKGEEAQKEKERRKLQPSAACPSCGWVNHFDYAAAVCARCKKSFL